uniref:50S ribosomal protein L16, chloroplastic n=1 Tax=Halimeda minima TaxID=170427 RepID=A0A386AYY0_9CHLO|nr:ribosomal protein L16 [Halimeda minima]
MLQPKRTKFRKMHRGRLKGKKTGPPLGGPLRKHSQSPLPPKTGSQRELNFALQALEPCWLTGRQIEAGRRVLSRRTRRGGKIIVHPFPDKPVTFRPPETRMGSGKGAPEYWIAVIKPGQLLYEIIGGFPIGQSSARWLRSEQSAVKNRLGSSSQSLRATIGRAKGVSPSIIREALKNASYKMPIKTKIIKKVL